MNERKIANKIIYVFVSSLLFALMFAVLFLNKSALWGLIVLALVTIGFYVGHHLLAKNGIRRGLRCLAWICWIGLFVVLIFAAWPATKAIPAVSVKDPQKTTIISLADGQVQGVYNEDRSVMVYAGIPYAKAPVGDLRWKAPRDPEPWQGVLVADTFAPMSMQPTNLPIYDSLAQIVGYHDYTYKINETIAPVSEDSLYVNVWRPAEGADLPVLVYVHGGSLKTGQPWYQDYNGEGLAKKGVVVVNMGYRLGVFGFMADDQLAAEDPDGSTGNYGLMDQIKALEWVQNNIASFGGDPANVTLAGESAGSASVSALCASPLAAGLFDRVILESSTLASVQPPHSFRPLGQALSAGKETLRKYKCNSIDELRAIPAAKLVSEAERHHHVTVDGYVLNETPYEAYKNGHHNETAILHGYNSEESGPFIIFGQANLKNYEKYFQSVFGEYTDEVLTLYPAETNEQAAKNWAEVFGAVYFDYPHYCLNRLATKNGITAYEYYFCKDNGRLGPWHSGEEVYCYGNIPADSKLYDTRDRELSEQMQTYWVNFAKNGDPNGAGLPLWEQNPTNDRVMVFGDVTTMSEEKKHELFAILDKLDGFDIE